MALLQYKETIVALKTLSKYLANLEQTKLMKGTWKVLKHCLCAIVRVFGCLIKRHQYRETVDEPVQPDNPFGFEFSIDFYTLLSKWIHPRKYPQSSSETLSVLSFARRPTPIQQKAHHTPPRFLDLAKIAISQSCQHTKPRSYLAQNTKMSDYSVSRPSGPDAFAETKIDTQDSLTNPFEMVEIFPNIFISSWPTHLPSNITNSLNLTTKDSVGKNDPDGTINHWHAPLKYEGDFFQSLPLILHAITDAVPRIDLSPNPPPRPKAILIYSEDGRNRAPAALLAYMCTAMEINVVDAFFILKKKKKDISVSGKYLQAIQSYLEHGEKFEDVEKEILRRLMSGLGAVMKKAEAEDWMYQAEE
ncbi:hypothetical protein DL98DRAFT_534841 [Cadophora sp. DSE1049]|nr:hypothetical protein DL98DRAFT_534841 [Cadophora sp. DSE1049]